MENESNKHHMTTRVLRWTARGWAVAGIVLVLVFFVGEGFDPSRIKPGAWSAFAAPGFLFLLCRHRSRRANTIKDWRGRFVQEFILMDPIC